MLSPDPVALIELQNSAKVDEQLVETETLVPLLVLIPTTSCWNTFVFCESKKRITVPLKATSDP